VNIPRSKLRKPQVDLADAIGFVLSHPRKQDAFPGWDDQQITRSLVEYNANETLIIAVCDGMVDGVATYDLYPEDKMLRVHAILTKPKCPAFLTFVELWYRRHPDYAVEGFRKGGTVVKRYELRDFSRYLKCILHETTVLAEFVK
jgi:hypothetical protein